MWPRRDDVRAVVGPRVHDGTVRVLQLTVDQAFVGDLPPAFTEVLDAAAARGDLVGHGVMASPYTVPRDGVARGWLRRAREVLDRWPVRWLTDHLGCARAGGWQAAPLPLPASRALVDHVVDHLTWLREGLGVPVGLENLALAASVDDALHQPELLEAMLAPVDGVLLLDLHNLWCSAVNTGLEPLALLERYPLDRVVQLHIAGGTEGFGVRRDTHDGPVPDPVWALLPEALARCPRLEVVVWERLRGTVDDAGALDGELLRLAEALAAPGRASVAGPLPAAPPWPGTDPGVAQEVLFAAARARDPALREAGLPGFWRDARTWAVAEDVTARWGRSVPGA